MLVGNNLAFALLYWEFDSGGPSARLERRIRYPDFAFPQQINPDLAPPNWQANLMSGPRVRWPSRPAWDLDRRRFVIAPSRGGCGAAG